MKDILLLSGLMDGFFASPLLQADETIEKHYDRYGDRVENRLELKGVRKPASGYKRSAS